MAKTSVERQHNRENLIYFSGILDDIEHFVFFGTLLGLEREGDIIEGDDDIDIYVPAHERTRLLERLASNGIEPDMASDSNKTPYMLQVSREVDGHKVLADFYLVEDLGNGFLADRWNFNGKTTDPSQTLHVPVGLVYPLQKRTHFGTEISLPQDPRGLCQFIYGPTWSQKLAKGTAYRTLIWRNSSKIFVGKLGLVQYRIYKMLKQARKFL